MATTSICRTFCPSGRFGSNNDGGSLYSLGGTPKEITDVPLHRSKRHGLCDNAPRPSRAMQCHRDDFCVFSTINFQPLVTCIDWGAIVMSAIVIAFPGVRESTQRTAGTKRSSLLARKHRLRLKMQIERVTA